MPFYLLCDAFQGIIDELTKCKETKHLPATCSYRSINLWKNLSLSSKTISQNSMVKERLKNFRLTFHTVGALSFKTYHRSFSLENAVSLTSSHAAEPCCITMTVECPSLSRKSLQSNSSLGEGKIEERGEEGEGVGQTKGNPITPGHGSSTSQPREIHHLQDQKETCAQGKAQWKLYPPM